MDRFRFAYGPVIRMLGHVLLLNTVAGCCLALDGISMEGVNQSPMAVEVQRAFPKFRIERPVVIDHPKDGSNRIFVCNQLGKIYSFPNSDDVEEPSLFMDMSDITVYDDKQNEEGLLGLAFHPRFKENGQFFVYYTSTESPQLSVISRFRTKTEDPKSGDRKSEEVLMKIKQPYWNHNGGTLTFGPDGYLYIGMGDGGFRNDPLLSAQNPGTLLGKILRIDVDRKDPGVNYAIPSDNPFTSQPGTRPEIYASGFRNVWRMSFDRKTGDFWVADVGQDLWEEINIVQRGGNYGWSIREAAHPFHAKQPKLNHTPMIDPIWEYPHTEAWGKSITGGNVSRGPNTPSLAGYYCYTDYVSGKVWALKYDAAQKRVTENRPIAWAQALPIITFGEDEAGNLLMGTATSGGMLFRFVEKKP